MNKLAWPVLIMAVVAMFNSDYALAAAQCTQTPETDTGDGVGASGQHLYEHSFGSGARWSLCVSVDEQSGLAVSQVHYAAPGDVAIKVLEEAALAQILFKYDEDTQAQHWLSEQGLGRDAQLEVNHNRCAGGEPVLSNAGPAYCVQHRNLNTLTSLRRSDSRRRHMFSLHTWSKLDAFVVEQVWEFTEDGQINPRVRIGGVLSRFSTHEQYSSDIGQALRASNASYVTTWRLDFNINDTPYNDIVESVEFIPQRTNALRRSISVTPLTTESLHKVDRERFKGWLVKDRDVSSGPDRDTRIGYYLDPQVSGFANISRAHNWSVFDLALSKHHDCEMLASGNQLHNTRCGDSLDDFINGELLENGDPVLWFSTARQFLPKKEDFPALTVRESSFTLMPFDWSASTPFSPLAE